MTKILSGTEIVGYIEERQARQVRALRQAHKVFPKFVIIKSIHASPVVDMYIRLKQRYADEILIESEVLALDEEEMKQTIARLNEDERVHGIIVQLPLSQADKTEDILSTIAPEKDIDGLGSLSQYDSATAEAINWLLSAYAVDLKTKKIAIIGNGRLVGSPLYKIWHDSNYDVTVLDEHSGDIKPVLLESDVVVSATGVPRLLTSDMIKSGATIVDAGTASENGVIVGDVDETVRARDDIQITPVIGGVGPVTIATLCDHVIQAATKVSQLNQS